MPAAVVGCPVATAFGSGGPGSIGHIVGEMVKDALKFNMTHMPVQAAARR